MRERSTWNREAIAKFAAAVSKKAEDPRAMNQDHLSQQPAADKYVTGGPSEFGEDVHPSSGTWKAEYSGGDVKRNELGMPEMRKDTFNHPEKTAADQQDDDSEDEALLEKKADVCLNVARKMLPKTASESIIEDQAVALMHLPNSALIETATRLAAEEEEEEEEGQDKQAQDQSQDDKAQDKQAQQGQLPDFIKKKQEEAEEEKKQAGQIPENFKKKDDEEGQGQAKQAQQGQQSQQDEDKSQSKQAQQQAQSQDEGQDKQAQQGQNPFAKKDEDEDKSQDKQAGLAKLVMAMQQGDALAAQQALQQLMQQAPQVPQAAPQDPMASDDQLLDQMLQQDAPVMASNTSLDGYDLQTTAMDVGEIKMADGEDEALRALFASHEEVQAATTARSLQAGVRTASTRTVGTRPTGGVSQLGGGVSEPSGGGDIEKLSSLWQSAPDVRNNF